MCIRDRLDAVHNRRETAGQTLGTDPVDDPAGLEMLLRLFLPVAVGQSSSGRSGLGWSNGNDSRIVRTPTTLWPWRAIAQFHSVGGDNSNCTGTLIGPRHLITAAHCINKMGTTTWYTFGVAPGRNGEDVFPYGDSVIDPNPCLLYTSRCV